MITSHPRRVSIDSAESNPNHKTRKDTKNCNGTNFSLLLAADRFNFFVSVGLRYG